MPVLPAVSRVCRIDLQHSGPGNPDIRYRLFLQYTGVLNQADADTWRGAIRTSYVTHLIPPLNAVYSLVGVTLTDLSSASAPQSFDGTATAGSNAAAPLPPGVALVLRHKIARRYRGGHPRTYLIAPDSTQLVTADQWKAAQVTDSVNRWQAFISDCLNNVPTAAAPAFYVNVSYFQGFHNVTFPSGRSHAVPTLRATPVVDLILATTGNPIPASQRRRNQN